ncbi:hypothetical protein TorRG33x02_310860 [Trema orientale]|uniref:Uncharacterized protein n=1 Tax=Trema orientale TaxID=63057 RepID=A0A2P5BS51_TREOI|nr:hypothetical protein TorRG33x02_310860 [Trema orientale]
MEDLNQFQLPTCECSCLPSNIYLLPQLVKFVHKTVPNVRKMIFIFSYSYCLWKLPRPLF